MDGFKKLPKMQHFKVGGAVKNAYCGGGKAYKKGGEVHDKADIKEDKKIVKKAISMHDKQQHEEKTDLSKLKKGGRAKKDVGTVKKFVKKETVVGMKKTPADKKQIAEVKKTKVEKLCKGGKPEVVKKKTGGKIKKMADGGLLPIDAVTNAINAAGNQIGGSAGLGSAGAGFGLGGGGTYDPSLQLDDSIYMNPPEPSPYMADGNMNQQPAVGMSAMQRMQGLGMMGGSRMAQARGSNRFNPERVKGGATVQPTPLPVRDLGTGNGPIRTVKPPREADVRPRYNTSASKSLRQVPATILPPGTLSPNMTNTVPGPTPDWAAVEELRNLNPATAQVPATILPPGTLSPNMTNTVPSPTLNQTANPMNGQFAAMKRGGRAKGKC